MTLTELFEWFKQKTMVYGKQTAYRMLWDLGYNRTLCMLMNMSIDDFGNEIPLGHGGKDDRH